MSGRQVINYAHKNIDTPTSYNNKFVSIAAQRFRRNLCEFSKQQ